MGFSRCCPLGSKITPIFPSDIAYDCCERCNLCFEEREREKSFRNEYNFIIYKVARNIFIVSKFPSRFYHFFSPFFTLHTRGSLKILSRPRVKAVNFSRIVIPTTRVSVLLHNAATVRTRKSRECFVPRCVEILPILFPIERIKRFVRTFTRSSKKKKERTRSFPREIDRLVEIFAGTGSSTSKRGPVKYRLGVARVSACQRVARVPAPEGLKEFVDCTRVICASTSTK